MADYSVTFARSARKELEKIPPSIAQRIIERIEALARVIDVSVVRHRRDAYHDL